MLSGSIIRRVPKFHATKGGTLVDGDPGSRRVAPLAANRITTHYGGQIRQWTRRDLMPLIGGVVN